MGGPIEAHLYVHKYPGAGLLLLPWAIVACVIALEQIPSVALQAARDFRFLAYVSLISAPVTVAATIGAILWRGYTWTMYGVAVGQIVSLAMVACRLYQVRRRLGMRGGFAEAPALAGAVELTPGHTVDSAGAAP
jgi:O-antigen/teichoic acid export membrane protein